MILYDKLKLLDNFQTRWKDKRFEDLNFNELENWRNVVI